MYYIHQSRKDNCGYACIKMLLASLNKDRNYLYLKEEKQEGNYSFKELVDIAKKEDVTLVGYRIKDINDALPLAKKKDFLLTIKSGKGKHLVVVKKLFLNLFLIKDPSIGSYVISKKKVEKIMDGTLLVVEEHKVKKANTYFPSLLSKGHKFVLCLFRILCLAFVIASTFFIDKSFSPLIPLFLLIGGLVMELIYRMITLRWFKKLDKVINDSVTVENNRYYDYYSCLQNYKSLYLTNITSVFFSLSLFIFIGYLLIGNETLNIIPALFTVFFVFFEQVFVKNKINIISNKLEKNEHKLRFSSNMEEYKNRIDVINRHSKNVGILKSVLDISYFFVLVILLAVIMYLRQKIEITYLLFYFFMFYFFKKCISDYFESKDKKESEKLYKVKLVNMTTYNNDFE